MIDPSLKPPRPLTSKKSPQIHILPPQKSSITVNKMSIPLCSAKASSAPHISMVLTLNKIQKKHLSNLPPILLCWHLSMATKMHNKQNRNPHNRKTSLLSIWKKTLVKIISKFITNTINNISKSTKVYRRTTQVSKNSKNKKKIKLLPWDNLHLKMTQFNQRIFS